MMELKRRRHGDYLWNQPGVSKKHADFFTVTVTDVLQLFSKTGV